MSTRTQLDDVTDTSDLGPSAPQEADLGGTTTENSIVPGKHAESRHTERAPTNIGHAVDLDRDELVGRRPRSNSGLLVLSPTNEAPGAENDAPGLVVVGIGKVDNLLALAPAVDARLRDAALLSAGAAAPPIGGDIGLASVRDITVAVCEAEVTDLQRARPVRAGSRRVRKRTQGALVDEAVAVLIERIAHLRDRLAARPCVVGDVGVRRSEIRRERVVRCRPVHARIIRGEADAAFMRSEAPRDCADE